MAGGTLLIVGCALDGGNIDFDHGHHRFHDTLRSRAIGVIHEFPETVGNDLPAETPTVLEPTADALFTAAFDKGGPKPINLGLVFTVNLEGDGLREWEIGATIGGRDIACQPG